MTDNENSELSLIDILVALAESWRWIVGAPIVAGLVAFAILWTLNPPEYESEAILNIDAREAMLLQTSKVLNAPLRDSHLFAETGALSLARLALLEQGFDVTLIEGANLYRVRLRDTTTPEDAQKLLQTIVASLIVNSAPPETERKRLEARQRQVDQSLAQLRTTLSALNRMMGDNGPIADNIVASSGEFGQSAVAIVAGIEQRQAEAFSIQEQLIGTVSQDDVIQTPTLPDRALARGTLGKVALAALAAGFLAVILAFVRASIQDAAKDPKNKLKVQRLQNAFRWRKDRGPTA